MLYALEFAGESSPNMFVDWRPPYDALPADTKSGSTAASKHMNRRRNRIEVKRAPPVRAMCAITGNGKVPSILWLLAHPVPGRRTLYAVSAPHNGHRRHSG